jgi:hypothetical protein
VPGGEAVGQAVLDHEAHRQGDDALGVVAARGREVGEVGAEVKATGFAAVLGVDDVEVPWAVPPQTADLMENAAAATVPVAAVAALWAGTVAVTTRAAFDQRPGQVLNTGNPFRQVREVFSWRHCLFSGTRDLAREITAKPKKTFKTNPTSLLQSH